MFKENLKHTEQNAQQKIVDLDSILTDIGNWGKYQCRVTILVMLITVISGINASEYIFTAARINTRCLIPECENSDMRLDFAPPWILNAVPTTSDGSFDSCRRYANTSTSIDISSDTCPAELFDRDTILSCDDHVYENTDTVAYNLNLACDEWRRTLIGSIRTFGMLVGLPIVGYMSDSWGRRTALVICAFNAAWIGIVRYWASTYIGYVVSVFFEAATGYGAFSSGYVLLIELLSSKVRVAGSTTINCSFSIGQIILGLLAWAVLYWRHLILIIYIPQLFTITYLWLVPESIRWYVSKGLYDKADKTLKHLAHVNGKQISDKSLLELRRHTGEEQSNEIKNMSEPKPWLIVLLLQHKKILVRCVIIPTWWISFTLIYYGLSINAVNISGHRYLNYIAVAAVDIPGYLSAMVLIDRIGRKLVLIGAFWVCSICQIMYIFLPNSLYGLSLSVYLIGKLFIAAVGTTMYVYTNELYPTTHRHTLFAFSSMMGRIGSVLAPFTPALGQSVWQHLPSTMFAGFAFVSGFLTLFMPETLGFRLPDTMEEAANIGRKNETQE